MYSFLKKHHRLVFFCSWLIINIIQAATTELFDDEAYYWIYSCFPAWGYFDHPPMIAMLIRAGYAISQDEFGIRLFIVFMNTATIYLVSNLVEGRNDKLFYSVVTTIVIAQIGGIIAVPDTPLLFFAAVFFLMYRKFAEKMNLLNSILLGVCVALMVYTKYHGFLIAFFTLLSNRNLFAKYQTYVVTAIALLLFFPHLYWQYSHGFPSVQFHLFERNASSYLTKFTTEYILGQLAIAGPVMGWLLIWAAVRHKPATATEKALQFTLIGFYLFFLLSTFKGRVEANWTVPAFISLIVLSHQYLNSHPTTRRWFYKTVPITVLLVIILRIYMMLDVPTSRRFSKDEFHQNRDWVDTITNKAAGRPVVFIDSYQRPSKYWFYSGEPALGLNTPEYRRNNFNFWPLESHYFGKPVLAVGSYDPVTLNDTIIAPRFRHTGSSEISFFYSFMRVRFTEVQSQASTGVIRTSFNVDVPDNYLSYFKAHPYDTASIQLAILNLRDTVRCFPSNVTVNQITRMSFPLSVSFPVQLPGGIYNARLGISSAVPGHPSLNSKVFQISVP